MKRSDTARLTSVYFAYDFSRGYYYAGFFGYGKYAVDAVEDRQRRWVPIL